MTDCIEIIEAMIPYLAELWGNLEDQRDVEVAAERLDRVARIDAAQVEVLAMITRARQCIETNRCAGATEGSDL